MPSSATLVLFNRHGRRKEVPLSLGTTVVGRRPDCDLRIPLAVISRKHCEIIFDTKGLSIKDLGSANGVQINNQRVTDTASISPGDTLRIGSLQFVVQIDGQPDHVYPPGDPDETALPAGLSGSGTGVVLLDDSLSDLDPTAG